MATTMAGTKSEAEAFALTTPRWLEYYKFPKLYSWGGVGVPILWSFGWETGKDDDLICVKTNVKTAIEGEIALSPACYGRLKAIFAFILKAILLRIDTNIHVMLEGQTMAIPAVYTAISRGWQMKPTSAMTFPATTSHPATICCRQQFITPATMTMSSLDTFASSARPSPSSSNKFNIKTCHLLNTSAFYYLKRVLHHVL